MIVGLIQYVQPWSRVSDIDVTLILGDQRQRIRSLESRVPFSNNRSNATVCRWVEDKDESNGVSNTLSVVHRTISYPRTFEPQLGYLQRRLQHPLALSTSTGILGATSCPVMSHKTTRYCGGPPVPRLWLWSRPQGDIDMNREQGTSRSSIWSMCWGLHSAAHHCL